MSFFIEELRQIAVRANKDKELAQETVETIKSIKEKEHKRLEEAKANSIIALIALKCREAASDGRYSVCVYVLEDQDMKLGKCGNKEMVGLCPQIIFNHCKNNGLNPKLIQKYSWEKAWLEIWVHWSN